MITWLASYPKSGNTWVRAFVDAYLRAQSADLNNLHGSDADINPKWFQGLMPVPLHTLSDQDRLLFRPAGLFHLSFMNRPPHLVKTHCMFCSMYGISMFPQGSIKRIIYLIRDPRDVVVSMADHLGVTIDKAIEVLNEDKFSLLGHNIMPTPVGSWSNHLLTWEKASIDYGFPLMVFRYEDLIEDPVGTFTNILDFWEQPVYPNRVLQAVERTRFNRLQAAEQEEGYKDKSEHSERFFRSGKVGGWTDTLTAPQVANIEDRHKGLMQRFGYTASVA